MIIDLIAKTATREELIELLRGTEEQRQELERENARLREVLRFYADPRKYQGPNCRPDDDEECVAGCYRLDVTRDGGKKARDILSNSSS